MMTDPEKELYLKIKQEPKNFLFKMLFQYDQDGAVIPIPGTTLQLMPDGIPMILDQAATVGLMRSGAPMPALAAIRSPKSYREIANEVAPKSPFKGKSMFYRAEREILTGSIPQL
jgi:hypothetical protein